MNQFLPSVPGILSRKNSLDQTGMRYMVRTTKKWSSARQVPAWFEKDVENPERENLWTAIADFDMV